MKPEYRSFCQNCVWETHPRMMSGYCLRVLKCDRCHRVADLAMVELQQPHMDGLTERKGGNTMNMESRLDVETACCNPYCKHPACTMARGRPLCDACWQAHHWGWMDALSGVLVDLGKMDLEKQDELKGKGGDEVQGGGE